MSGNRFLFFISLLILSIPCTAHAKMIDGKLIELKTGAVLNFRIQKKMFGSKGKMEASFKAGEVNLEFKGEYVAIRQKQFKTAFGQAHGPGGSAYGSGFGTSQSSVVPAQGTMTGPNGIVISCQFTIQSGLSPHGMGQCQDNRGNQYNLQF